MSIVETMKAEAAALGGKFVSWREGGDYLVNCRANSGGYEWRKVDTASGPGAVISEKRAAELLALIGA